MQKTAMPDGSGYFLYHSIGQYPDKASEMRRATADFADLWGCFDDSQWPNVLPLKTRFIDGWSQLINAPRGTLTTAENVTVALYSLIGALPAQHLRGKRVLVAQDCFPSLHFLLAGIADRFEFTLDTVPLRQGATWVEDDDMIAQWGDDVGLALLTWVTSTASHRCNLDRLVAHGRAKGSLVGVDITQAAGLLDFDVMAPAVDFTLSTSLKWLCGTSGAGILHVAEPLLHHCTPELRGWFSQENPFSWDLDKFTFAPDSRRFDHGTPAMMALAASLPALEWNLAQPPHRLRDHNRALTAQLISLADDLALPLATPRTEDARGGSVMIRCPSAEASNAAVAALREAAVFTDARGATLRLSPGICTTNQGIARLAATLRACMVGG
tara:strand:- start:65082 stop:66230 length:1149 start_codon:yes stop_codon:yes gene_type:complete